MLKDTFDAGEHIDVQIRNIGQRVGQINDPQKVEEALKNDLLVGVMFVVALKVLGVIFEVLCDLEMVYGKERHGLIEIFCFLTSQQIKENAPVNLPCGNSASWPWYKQAIY